MTKTINPHALSLLRTWFYLTREANVRSRFPDMGIKWEKRGLAWVPSVTAPVGRGTKPADEPDWREAGYAFHKACEHERAEALVLLFLFGPDADGRRSEAQVLSLVAARVGVGVGEARRIIRDTLRAYDHECARRGLVDSFEDEDDDMANLIRTWSEIAALWGVSVPTAKRDFLMWIEIDPTFPGKLHPVTGKPWVRVEELAAWRPSRVIDKNMNV